MRRLRSRAGIVTLTACAFALLSVPVLALGKGPPDVKGAGTDTAGTVVPPQANVPSPPPGQLNRPDSAPRPAPAPAPTQSQGQASAPGPPSQAPPAWAPGSARAKANSPKRRGPKSAPPPASREPAAPAQSPSGSEQEGGGSEPGNAVEKPSRAPSRSRSPDKPDFTGALELPRADTPDTGGGDIAGALVADTVELPEDASPETLPFTGLQLALVALAGLAVMAGGLALRRTLAG